MNITDEQMNLSTISRPSMTRLPYVQPYTLNYFVCVSAYFEWHFRQFSSQSNFFVISPIQVKRLTVDYDFVQDLLEGLSVGLSVSPCIGLSVLMPVLPVQITHFLSHLRRGDVTHQFKCRLTLG